METVEPEGGTGTTLKIPSTIPEEDEQSEAKDLTTKKASSDFESDSPIPIISDLDDDIIPTAPTSKGRKGIGKVAMESDEQKRLHEMEGGTFYFSYIFMLLLGDLISFDSYPISCTIP